MNLGSFLSNSLAICCPRRSTFRCQNASSLSIPKKSDIGFIVDFYCAALQLVIEIEGESHFTEQEKQYDAERTGILEGYGLKVVRLTNVEVLQSADEFGFFYRRCRRMYAL